MELAGILFDLDGTLVDTERESAEAMARALAEGQGIEITQKERDLIIGRSWVEIHRDLQRAYPQLEWDVHAMIAETASRRELVFEEVGITVLPGAVATVERFSHLPLGLVTGSSRVEAQQALRALDLEQAFGAVFASEDVPTSKPHPGGYLAAADKLGVDPARCLVIEDSTPGIAAGRAAGARVVAVKVGNFAGHDQSSAHRIIETLEELTGALIESL
jgi:HAD superfamily hydrolase (TIGR01509 family)